MEQVRDAYGALADRYIELFGSTAQAHDDDIAFISRHLLIRPGVVLDAGCGPGHLTEHLRSLGVGAVGIDLVPQFVEHARRAYPVGSYLFGSMARLPVAEGSIAGILAWYSLIHMSASDLDDVLAELRRAVAPGGTLVVGFFDGDEVAEFEHKAATGWMWPADAFSARLRAAGFNETARLRRSAQNGHRAHAVIAAIAGEHPTPG